MTLYVSTYITQIKCQKEICRIADGINNKTIKNSIVFHANIYCISLHLHFKLMFCDQLYLYSNNFQIFSHKSLVLYDAPSKINLLMNKFLGTLHILPCWSILMCVSILNPQEIFGKKIVFLVNPQYPKLM